MWEVAVITALSEEDGCRLLFFTVLFVIMGEGVEGVDFLLFGSDLTIWRSPVPTTALLFRLC